MTLNTDLFCRPGEELADTLFKYVGCGLDNIFLMNGYHVRKHDGEDFVSVSDVQGLHRAIGRHLVLHRKGLSPKEVRFLRKTMALTQSGLAKKLGNDSQAVARWEKGTSEMPGTAEKLLRTIYLAENVSEPGDLEVIKNMLVSIMDDLDSLDESEPAQAKFLFGNCWNEAPKKAA